VQRLSENQGNVALLALLDSFSTSTLYAGPAALHDSQIPPETLGLSPAETARYRVNQKAYLAYQNYRPRFYRGKMKLVTTEKNYFFPKDPTSIWGGLVSELEVDVIPGDHLSIVTTEFEALAALLTDYVKQVSPQHV
ncbi:MAG: hypothetical protein ACXVJ1_17205, partial [Candidatus Angelobacter sp.]